VTLWVIVANRFEGHHLPLVSFIRRASLGEAAIAAVPWAGVTALRAA
jgi:hypothetical protein